MHAAPLPPKWEPGGWAKGLFLPPSTVVTWQIDSNGDPTHDQGAKLLNVDLVECLSVLIDEDGRVSLLGWSDDMDVAAFEKAALQHDARLWFGDSREWG